MTTEQERIAVIKARLAAATPGPWRMHLRDVSARAGDYTQDEISGLGWDWDDRVGRTPEPQLRGILARGADAALVSHMHEDLAYLLHLLGVKD